MDDIRGYKTVTKEASAEQIIERSRFICHVSPAATKEEADAFIASIRKEYKDATHNVPAMVIGSGMEIQWASDDGEPQGTSGAPVVHMLVEEGITNVVLVVTRYFGGIKLGTGGLVRAYTSSARLGIEASGISSMEPRSILKCRTDYKSFNRIQAMELGKTKIEDVEYTDEITFSAVCIPEEKEACLNMLISAAAGGLKVIEESSELVAVPL